MAESDLIRGNVDTVILKVLFEGDRYGYDMIKIINARSGGKWELKQPTLYACLKRLEKQGFVTSYWDASESNGGRRKYYTLTDRGRDVFIAYRTEYERTRDIFGELIISDEPISAVDDFGDVEEEMYDLPKRRSNRKRKKAEEQPKDEPVDIPPQPVPDTVEEQAAPRPAEPETFEPESAFTPDDGNEDFRELDVDDTAPDIGEIADDAEFIGDDGQAEEEHAPQYVQDSFLSQEPIRAEDIIDRSSNSDVDPHSLIEEMYAETYTGKDSYYRARGRIYDEEYTESTIQPRAGSLAPPAPAQSTVPAQKPVEKPAVPAVSERPAPPAPEHRSSEIVARNDESIARIQYREVLSDLVDRCDSGVIRADETAATDEVAEDGEFDDVMQNISELGNEVTVREHNDSAKTYNRQYKYRSSRLMMTHYTIMCATMFALGLIMFLTFYLGGLDKDLEYNYLLYIFAGLLPIIMFITAVAIFAYNPDRTRRINVNYRFSMIIRFVIMIQVAVVIYCLNIIWGMPSSFDAAHIPSLMLPLVYALFIPASEVIFVTLLRSGKYAV